jgi:hypothetical protein
MRALLGVSLLALCLPLAAGARTSRYEDRELPLGMGVTSASRIEPFFGKIASSLADKTGELRCWSGSDWARINGEFISMGSGGENLDYVSGFYRPTTNRIHLAPVVCSGLVQLHYQHRHPMSGKAEGKIALAVVTLAHESMHMRGFLNEATAECYAEQLVATTAHKLGASWAYGQRLEALSWQQLYPDHPPQYLSGQCRDGGTLDLNAKSHVFP